MPHPSGRNRKWNDKVFKEEKIKTLRTFILSV
jgi:uracil-DNA glycosylase